MNFREHLIAGAIGSVAIAGTHAAITQSVDLFPLISIACLFGSLAPDLDTQSKPSKFVALLLSAFCVYSIIVREPYFALFLSAGFLFIKSFNHRTFTHIWTLPIILCFVAYKTDTFLLYSFSFGLCVHYSVDCLGPKKMYPWRVSNWIKPIKIL